VRNDLGIYERAAADWWNPSAPTFRSLHRAKEFHLEVLLAAWGPSLPGATLVDLGCGGGLLAVPLAERGAEVIGVDLGLEGLRAAAREAGRRGVPCEFLRADLTRTPLPPACADFVVLSDVLEHLPTPAAALAEASRLLKTDGQLFANTINRTWRARILAVTLAEQLRLLPPGTHDPRLFVRPDELVGAARAHGLRVESLHGERVRVLATVRGWAIRLKRCRGLGVSYSAFFVKAGTSTDNADRPRPATVSSAPAPLREP
jgi:2-polyprenyl-6-hydroxyphenyl methylase/3-demethylubiquinone-9 3-methyltransferase